MSEQTELKLYPEKEAEIRLVLKVKQTSNGGVTGYIYNFEINNYEGLIPNATKLAREYDFQYASDKMIDVAIEHIKEHRS